MDFQLYNGLKYYLTHDKFPSNINSDTQRGIATRVHDYVKKDGLLFFQPDKTKEPRLVIDESKVARVLAEGHSGTYGGHFNLEATYNKLKDDFYWPSMYKTIEDFTKTCDTCQRRGRPKRNNPLRPITVSEPFELIGVDLVGPLKITNSGNRYIIVMTEYLTKWVEAKPIP